MSNFENMAKLAIEKSLLKEYKTSESSRTVYMKDGDEFQFQLFNPTENVIGISISLNNKEISDRRIILKPGERVWLERYLDEARKFRFDVYEVEDNNEDVKKAIAKNGNVKISFYKEEERPRITTSTFSSHPSVNQPYKWTSGNWNPVGTNILYSSSDNMTYLSSSSCGDAVDTCATLYNCSCDINNDSNTLELSSVETSSKALFETGRIGMGDNSDQDFSTTYVNLEYFPFYTAEFKILPMSRKPVSSSDLQKIYCTECGRKLNAKFKFCPYCGTETIK